MHRFVAIAPRSSSKRAHTRVLLRHIGFIAVALHPTSCIVNVIRNYFRTFRNAPRPVAHIISFFSYKGYMEKVVNKFTWTSRMTIVFLSFLAAFILILPIIFIHEQIRFSFILFIIGCIINGILYLRLADLDLLNEELHVISPFNIFSISQEDLVIYNIDIPPRGAKFIVSTNIYIMHLAYTKNNYEILISLLEKKSNKQIIEDINIQKNKYWWHNLS
jgi:hypothetical protein